MYRIHTYVLCCVCILQQSSFRSINKKTTGKASDLKQSFYIYLSLLGIVAATGYQVYGEPDLSELLVNKTHT